MAWVCRDAYGLEKIFQKKPFRETYGCCRYWGCDDDNSCILLPKGSIKKLIGRELKWVDEPVELKDE